MNIQAISLTVIMGAAVFVKGFEAMALEIVGHRGASADAPENTLAAFKLGYAQNADAVECDIYLSKDGKIVVMHDGNTARTSGVTNKIANRTFAQLRRLEVGQWGQWKGKGFSEKVPSLEEVLSLVPNGKRLFIEIKCGAEVLPELVRVLKNSGKNPHQTVIIGFTYETVQQAKQVLPQLEVLWLAAPDKKDKSKPALDELIEKARAATLDGLNLEAGFPIDASFVQKVHAAGLKLYTWTVDDSKVARKEAAAGVDGITTNRPEWLRRELSEKAE